MNWRVQAGKGIIRVIGCSPDNNQYVTVVADRLPKGTTLDAYFETNFNQAPTDLPGFKELSRYGAYVGGKEARILVATITKGIIKAKIEQVYIVFENKGYLISCVAGADEFDDYSATFEGIINSFQFPPYR
jgi:hypothetical protein